MALFLSSIVKWCLVRVDYDEEDVEFNMCCRLSRPETMNDDEVTQILKKWSLSNPPPKKNAENVNTLNQNEFDSRTFTRPKRRGFAEPEQNSQASGVS